MIKKTVFVLSIFFSAAVGVAQVSADPLFEAKYKGKHSGIGITLVRTLNKKGENSYLLRSDASSFVGSIDESSEFKLDNNTMVPHRYSYVRSIFGKKSKQYLAFDWDKMEVAYRREDKPKKNRDYALKAGALDNALFQLKMQQEVFNGQEKFVFEFAKEGQLKKREFVKAGTSEFELDNKTYEAVELRRINQPDEKETSILLIPDLNYQIAKITHIEEDGSTYKVELKSFSYDTKALTQFYQSVNRSAENSSGNKISEL